MASKLDKKSQKRNKVKPTESKWNAPTLSTMRETVFGSDARKEVRDTLQHADRLRDNDKLMSDAEAKRLRKAERNRKNAG